VAETVAEAVVAVVANPAENVAKRKLTPVKALPFTGGAFCVKKVIFAVMKKIFLAAAVALFSTVLFAQDKDWAQLGKYAEQNAQVTVRPKAVLFGDSITWNWAKFDKEWLQEHNFVGRGISGQTTAEMLVRFRQDVIELKPRYVVILAGINDIARNNGYISVENTFKNIVSMVELAKANKIKPVLCTLVPAGAIHWRPSVGDPRPQIDQLNALITAYAKANRIKLVDYHTAMKDADDALDAKYRIDGVHPNIDGYKVMEPLLLSVIK
jgi:lysophospholipase L1-like esterase